MKKAILSWLFFLLLAIIQVPANAQYDLDNPSRVIRVEDGLPNHYLRGITQDKFGFVWIGSYYGLSRFDGKAIKVFRHVSGDSTSLTQNSITSLATDPNNGEVWIGTFGGLNVYQPAKGNFRTYTYNDQDPHSLPSNFVSWVFVDRQSDTWIGNRAEFLTRLDSTKSKFVKYRPTTLQTEEAETIRAIDQDGTNDSLIWLGTQNRLFSFNKYRNLFNYDHPDFSAILQIHALDNGLLYIRDETGQISLYQPATKEVLLKITPRTGWNFGWMYPNQNGELWMSCNRGIAVLNTRNHRVSYPWSNDPVQNKEYDIDMIDQQGRIWTTSTAGINIYDPSASQFFNYRYGAEEASSPFITQRMWEDTEEQLVYVNANAGYGIYRFDLNTREWLHIPMPADYPGELFYGSDLSQLQNGQLLILDRRGLFTLSSNGRSMITHPLSKKLPEEESWVKMFVDSKGYIWLGGVDNGVIKINSQTWEIESLAEWLPPCRQARFRWAFYEDSQQNVWISVCGGMAFYSYDKKTFHFLLHEDNPENTFREPKDFAEDTEGILLVSSEAEGQLGEIDPKDPKKGIYRKYSFADNVAADSVRILKGDTTAALGVGRMTLDQNNNVWTYGPTGILKIYPDRRSVEIYNELDGLQWLDEKLKVPTISQIGTLSTGEIVLGLRKIMSVFDPHKLSPSQERPQPYLTAFNVYNNPWKSDSSLFFTRHIDLKYWENYFSFEFSSIGFTNPDHFQYQYKLEGVDEEWVYSGQRSYAAYTNVEGGKYTFMVKAANSDGLWNETPLAIDLFIAIPWWKQLWFRIGMVLLLLGGIYAFYRNRIHQIRKAERLRSDFENKLAGVELTALRSQMNPHFIFNCLNSIESYIIKNETIKASEYLNDFSRLIRLILQNSRSNYVTLKDELEALTLYMEMENLRLTKSFNYELRIDENLDPENTEIPPMLMQPYVENAIWHGLMHKEDSGTIVIELKQQNDFLLCTIEDNGVGRQRAAELRPRKHKKTSMGMNITQERIDIINKAYNTETSVKVIDLVSPEGEAIGTRVELRIRPG